MKNGSSAPVGGQLSDQSSGEETEQDIANGTAAIQRNQSPQELLGTVISTHAMNQQMLEAARIVRNNGEQFHTAVAEATPFPPANYG